MKPSSDLFERFFLLTNELFIVTDGKGGIAQLNARWKEVLGYELSELQAINLRTLFHPDELEQNQRFRDEAQKAGFALDYENRVVRKDGGYAWLRWRCYLDGETGFIYGIANDVTKEKLADDNLRRVVTNAYESEQFERVLSQISPVAIFRTDLRGYVTYVNPVWEELAGMPMERALGKGWIEAIHPEDRQWVPERRANSLGKGTRRPVEYRFKRPDGKVSWMYGSHAPMTDMQGNAIGYVGAALDITELRENIEKSELLRQLIESSKDGFGYCDPECRPIYLNRFLTEELGWSLGEDSIYDLVSAETGRLYREHILPLLAGGKGQWEGEVEFLNRNTGELIPIWQKAFCSLDAEGKPRHFAFFATDLRGKRSSEAAILHSSKMASLGQMAAGVAHEVNNPITIIHGTSVLLQRIVQNDEFDREKLEKGLERIEKTAMRISKIVRGLRMFSRSGENDPPVPTSVKEIVEETLEVCRERFRDHAIELRVAEPPELQLRCRPTQISQVLLNLLNNSFDAVTNYNEKWVEIDFSRVDGRVRISVTDSGTGIPADIVRRLMEPFFTTKDPGKGTGLGLPISRGIVEEHGGKLAYDLESPRTRFVIEMPVFAGIQTEKKTADEFTPAF